MRYKIFLLLVVAYAVLGLSFLNAGMEWEQGPIGDVSASVFKIQVKFEGGGASEGTGFVIHSTGNPNNPTLYLLTAAHVILGDNAGNDTRPDVVLSQIDVRYGSGQSEIWTIKEGAIAKSVSIPNQWNSSGRDFALIKIIGAGRKYRPLCLANRSPEPTQPFETIGFLQGSFSSLTVQGKVLTGAGQGLSKPWFIVEAPSLSHGMSGGPALSNDGVFALVRGAPEEERSNQQLLVKTLIPLTLAETFLRDNIPDWKAAIGNDQDCIGRVQTWDITNIQRVDQNTTTTWSNIWTDIQWVNNREGWLSGAKEIGGGVDTVGRGILLHTTDGGASWTEVDKQDFQSGSGSFSWGPYGNRLYTWNEVGPIYSLAVYPKNIGNGKLWNLLWLASATGVYFSNDGHGLKWTRFTPPPDDPKRYALFAGFVGIEANSEIYAVGWQGIAHWYSSNGRWYLEKPTYEYGINAIANFGGSENRNVWAVGRAGVDEEGRTGSDSHGAIYHLRWPDNEWEKVPLPGIKFESGQSLTDVLLVDPDNVFAIGANGLMLRGSRQDDKWSWSRLKTETKMTLNSIAYGDGTLWAVGENGVIIQSKDKGQIWSPETVSDSHGKLPNLHRIRVTPNGIWIVGDYIVLKSKSPIP